MSHAFGKLGMGVGILLLLGFYGFAFRFAPINADAGFLLSTVARLQEGRVLYRDLQLGYTPLGIYILALGQQLSIRLGYSVFLGGIYLTHVACAGVLWRLCFRYTQRKILAWLGAIWFLLLAFNFEASLISLEPFVALFALLAWSQIGHPKRRWVHFLGAGIWAGASFLSKQYGLAIMLPLCLHILMHERAQIAQKTILLIGGWTLLPLLLCLYYYWSYGYGADLLWQNWLMPGFGANPDAPSWGEVGLTWIKFIGLYFPGVLIGLIGRSYWEKQGLGAAIAALALSTPLVFGLFPHYFLMALAFYVLMTVTYYHKVRHNERKHKIFVILMLLSVSWCTLRAANIVRYLWEHKDQRELQQIHAESLQTWITPGEQVLVLGAHFQSLYYLGKYKPVLAKQVGYTFPEHFSEKELNAILEKSTWVLIQENDKHRMPLYAELLAKYQATPLATSFYGVEIWRIDQNYDSISR